MDVLSAMNGPRPGGRIDGLAVGTVANTDDDAKLGRVRVRLPWHAENDTSFWAKLSVPMAGADRGIFFLPEVGDEVLLGFENGDPSHPYVIGSLWSESRPPPERESGSEERVIKTRSGHMMRFSDSEDEPEAEIALADGKRVTLGSDGVVLSDGVNEIIMDPVEGSITLKASVVKLANETGQTTVSDLATGVNP